MYESVFLQITQKVKLLETGSHLLLSGVHREILIFGGTHLGLLLMSFAPLSKKDKKRKKEMYLQSKLTVPNKTLNFKRTCKRKIVNGNKAVSKSLMAEEDCRACPGGVRNRLWSYRHCLLGDGQHTVGHPLGLIQLFPNTSTILTFIQK